MSPDPGSVVTIPARITVAQLASVIGIEPERVQEMLAVRAEPASDDDFVAADLAQEVAREAGVSVNIEPRDLALEVLYGIEVGGEAPDPGGLTGRVKVLVDGVLEHLEALDHEIEAASEHWSVARMPVIDRNILRLGLFELRHSEETPTAVVVSEAVRLAKIYSTERSGAFVNGVLASLSRISRG
jgi:N utilization substance protein B